MSLGVLDRKREMLYTQRQLAAAKCTTRKATPEEIDKILNKRGNAMGARGPKPGSKRDKRVNINELADQAIIQVSKQKDLAKAVRENIEAEVDAAPPVTEKTAPVAEPANASAVREKLLTIGLGASKKILKDFGVDRLVDMDPSDYPKVLKMADDVIEDKLAKSMEDAVDATAYALHGMSYAEFKAKQETNTAPNTKEAISGVFADEGFTPSPELVKQIRHERVCGELTALYLRKNHDYGDSFSETYRKLGIISAVTRITDKVNRVQSLCTKEQRVNDEGIRDTLVDLANYAIMTIMEMDQEAQR